jgi:hypothetical protein
MVRDNVDYVPIDRVAGRIATTLMLVYPPGIATIVPGERLDERAQPMIDYLLVFQRAANLFPGFETKVQGRYREREKASARRTGRSGSIPTWCGSEVMGRSPNPGADYSARCDVLSWPVEKTGMFG